MRTPKFRPTECYEIYENKKISFSKKVQKANGSPQRAKKKKKKKEPNTHEYFSSQKQATETNSKRYKTAPHIHSGISAEGRR